MLPIVVSALGIVLSALTIIEKVNSWTVVGIGGFTVRGLRVVDFTILFSSKGHLSFEILSILIISLQYVVQDHLEDFNWCCHGICNPTAHSRGKQHCISQNLEVKKFLIDALIYEVLFLNLSSIF